MTQNSNSGTGNIPLMYAQYIKELANKEFENGSLYEKITPTTKRLLEYWFSLPYTDNRDINFHQGQRQAILNTIYVHEVLKPKSAIEMCEIIGTRLKRDLYIHKELDYRYSYPKYAIKMATGTGKTWVMHALIIWQYLNARHEACNNGIYSKNFLLIAPGLIVYDRLLDAYSGRISVQKDQKESREFNTSDIKTYSTLLIPDEYREEVLNFFQNSLVTKKEISSKVTGDGMIAITNWHLLSSEDENESESTYDVSSILNDVFPITPGKTANHSLETLDSKYIKGNQLEYLLKLKDIVVINDEAHHVHDKTSSGYKEEVKWQQSLNKIAESKKNSFIQIDFTATPYSIMGSGLKSTKHYFPHIIVDYGLNEAIKTGLVKTIVIDKRKRMYDQNLETLNFKVIRESNKVISLSEGQKTMIRAGLQKLKILEKQFVNYNIDKNNISNKYPKMLIICEDTMVSPFIVDYLIKYEGLNEDDIIRIDSDSKGDVSEKNWFEIKERLFNIDNYPKPKVIVSVLMLREGFDVNNICVIIPLRASEAPILLEQTIGRGLRLMWREKLYNDLKASNRKRLLEEKKAPDNYLDILSIIEHPRFQEFYDNLINQGLCGEDDEMQDNTEKVLGDLIKVPLKDNYEQFDIYVPSIIKDEEENIEGFKPDIYNMEPYKAYTLEQLKQFIKDDSGIFYSEELTVKTIFGDYKVPSEVFCAESYNEYISKIVSAVNKNVDRLGKYKDKEFIHRQINIFEIAKAIDMFIRKRLFNIDFNPLQGNDWKVLLMTKYFVVEHIIKEINKLIYMQQNGVKIESAVVIKKHLSEVREIKMRKNYSIEVSKSIYDRLPYPSNKGGFERDFIIFCDRQSDVESFVKIKEVTVDFMDITYIRNDGMFARYFIDFIVKYKDKIYLVETKAEVDKDNVDIKNKAAAAVEWVKKVNSLNPVYRMNRVWHYVLLSDKVFYKLKANGESLRNILELTMIIR